MKHLVLTLLIALVGLVAAPQPVSAQLLPQYQSTPIDGIVAVVDDDVILRSELDQAVGTVMRQFTGNPSQLPPHDVLEHQVLERLILQRLQVHRANDMGIRVTQSDVEQAIGSIAEQNHMSPDQLRGAVTSDGTSFASFQTQVADQILVQKLRGQVLSNIQVTDSEIDNLIASPTFKAGQVRLAHIAINLPQGASADDIAKAQAKAEEVEKAIAGGMDFNAAAIRFSQAPDALEGGDLGWRSLDEVPPSFVPVVQKLQVGEVTQPLRSPDGFQILKLVDQRKQGNAVVKEYHARHILLRPNALRDDAQTEARIRDLYQQLTQHHGDFAKLAKANSDDDTTANVGGDMGWFPLNAWGSGVAAVLDKLAANGISEPFQVGGGWDIIQLLGTREQDRTKEVERENARQAIENRKAEDTYNNFLRDLRAQAYIEDRLAKPAGSGDAAK